jgi:hypothetical protein
LDAAGVAGHDDKIPLFRATDSRAQATDGGGISVFNDLTLIRWHSALPAKRRFPVRSAAIEFILFALAQALLKGCQDCLGEGIGMCLPDTAESEKRPEIKHGRNNGQDPAFQGDSPVRTKTDGLDGGAS